MKTNWCIGLLGVCIAIAGAESAAFAQPLPRSVGIEKLRPFFDRIEIARGTVVVNSDSRMLYQNHGIQHGIERAFNQPNRPDSFGTIPFSPGRYFLAGDGIGWQWTNNGFASSQPGMSIDPVLLPAHLLPYHDPVDTPALVVDMNWLHQRIGLNIQVGSWIWGGQPLRLDIWHNTRPGGGSFLPTRRSVEFPWPQESWPQPINTSGVEGMTRSTFTWTTTQPWQAEGTELMMDPLSSSGLPVGLVLQFIQATIPSKGNGVCVGARGASGHSAIDNYLHIFPATANKHWTDEGRRWMLETYTSFTDGWLLIVHYLDVNDRNEHLPSVHGILPGNALAAYRDNMLSTMDAYDAYAPDASKVYHLIVGSPRLMPGENEQIVPYHHVMVEMAGKRPRTGFVGLQTIMPDHATLVAQGIFPTVTEVHQTLHGSEVIGNEIITEVYRVLYGGGPDLNGDGIVGAADLGMLLGAWGPCPAKAECPADLNIDGVVNAADLGILLGSWGPIG